MDITSSVTVNSMEGALSDKSSTIANDEENLSRVAPVDGKPATTMHEILEV